MVRGKDDGQKLTWKTDRQKHSLCIHMSTLCLKEEKKEGEKKVLHYIENSIQNTVQILQKQTFERQCKLDQYLQKSKMHRCYTHKSDRHCTVPLTCGLLPVLSLCKGYCQPAIQQVKNAEITPEDHLHFGMPNSLLNLLYFYPQNPEISLLLIYWYLHPRYHLLPRVLLKWSANNYLCFQPFSHSGVVRNGIFRTVDEALIQHA